MPHSKDDSKHKSGRETEDRFADRLSKRLCYILRYGAIQEGLTVHDGGISNN